MEKNIKQIHWMDCDDILDSEILEERVYLGEELCERRLPAGHTLERSLRHLKDSGCDVTLVTPFVSEDGLEYCRKLIDRALTIMERIEVVCNDWGVLFAASERSNCTPVIGRLLSRQDTDPRLPMMFDSDYQKGYERDFPGRDGIVVRLKYAAPGKELLSRIKKASIVWPELLELLRKYRVSRFEINNLLQGAEQTLPEGWHTTLHIPEVLITVERSCYKGRCSGSNGCIKGKEPVELSHESFPLPLFKRLNGIYYLNDKLPANCEEAGIDRIVVRSGSRYRK